MKLKNPNEGKRKEKTKTICDIETVSNKMSI